MLPFTRQTLEPEGLSCRQMEGQRAASHLGNPVSVTSIACVEHLHGRILWKVEVKKRTRMLLQVLNAEV